MLLLIIPHSPKGEGGILFYLCRLSVLPSVQDIFRHIFLSNYWWQRSDTWSQASYRYPISWEAFLDPSDSYFLFADLVGFYTHWTYMHIFRHIFLSNFWQKSHKLHIATRTIDGRNLIFCHKLHIGTPYRGKGFWTHQIPASCLPICWFLYTFNIHLYIHIFRRIFLSNYWWQKSDIWSQASYRYPILCETFFDPSDSYFLFAEERGYHRWALAHSSSCFFCWKFFWKQKKILFHLLTSGIYYLQFKNR